MQKAFVYLGKDERISDEVKRNSDAINNAYFSLLGKERFEELSRINQYLLRESSFFENQEQLEVFGFKPLANECSKFIMACSEKDSSKQKSDKNAQIRVAPAFYVSESSFNHSGSKNFTNNPISTYIHEFNHYIGFALQKVPIYFASMLLSQETNGQLRREGLENFLIGAVTDASPPSVKQKKFAYAFSQIMFDQSYEQMNRILDSKIMGSIGIKFNNSQRGKKKEFAVMQVPGIGTFGIPISGDFFYGLSDRQAFENFMNWEKHFNLRGVAAGHGSYDLAKEFSTLVQKVSSLNIKKVPFSEIELSEMGRGTI